MPASYTDQFWLIDPFAPPPSGTQLLVQTYDMIDANDDGQIGGAVGDMVDGVVVVRAYPGDSVTVTWPNGTQSTVTGTTRLSSSHTCVMPTFSPTSAFVAMAGVFLSSRERSARAGPGGAPNRLCHAVPAAGLHGRQFRTRYF